MSSETMTVTLTVTDAAQVFSDLSDDILVEMLFWVPPMELIRTVSQVCKRLCNEIRKQTFWRHLAMLHLPDLPDLPDLPESCLTDTNFGLTKHQLQRCCLCATLRKLSRPFPQFLESGSVVVQRKMADSLRHSKPTSLRACVASSTEYTCEYIENVLMDESDNESIEHLESLPSIFPGPSGRRWWSSRQSSTQEATEVLLFTTRYPLALISDVAIKPLRDPFQRDRVYSWKNTIIKAYRLPLGADSLLDDRPPGPTSGFPCVIRAGASSESVPFPQDLGISFAAAQDNGILESALRGQTPMYESPMHAVGSAQSRSDRWLKFKLPPGVIANVITVSLLGKNTRQFPTSGFYACVSRLVVIGIPLYTHPNQMKDVVKARQRPHRGAKSRSSGGKI